MNWALDKLDKPSSYTQNGLQNCMHEEEFFEMQSLIPSAMTLVCCQTQVLNPFLKEGKNHINLWEIMQHLLSETVELGQRGPISHCHEHKNHHRIET